MPIQGGYPVILECRKLPNAVMYYYIRTWHLGLFCYPNRFSGGCQVRIISYSEYSTYILKDSMIHDTCQLSTPDLTSRIATKWITIRTLTTRNAHSIMQSSLHRTLFRHCLKNEHPASSSGLFIRTSHRHGP